MTPPESNEGFDLACMCKLGRILGGHDPVTAVRQFAPTLEMAVRSAAIKVLNENGGSYADAAQKLGVNRGTLYQWFPKPKNIIRLAACLVAVVLVGCGTVPISNRQSPIVSALPALPRTLTTAQSSVAPVRTNGVVTLKWANGEPAETVIVNQTTGTVYPATTAETLTVGGLAIGSTQTFIATNASGASLPASAVVTPDNLKVRIFISKLGIAWDGPAGILQSSTNNVLWRDERAITTGAVLEVSPTERARFYRVKL